MSEAALPLAVLVLNSGSSSLKFGVYAVDGSTARVLLSGAAETGDAHAGTFAVQDAEGHAIDCDPRPPGTPHAAMDRIAGLLAARDLRAAAIGHRIVHGGPGCREHSVIDAAVMQQLEAAKAFAPLHVPPALAWIACARERYPGIPQVACLDTAFHAQMPEVARNLPIPLSLRRLGIERYGFHGLSCESIVRQLGTELPPRLLIAHLGHGASVTALANGRSIDTSMGLTPTGGVMMSTRCGDIDPGVLAYLVRELHFDAAQLEEAIDRDAGMLAISGLSGDMRELHAAADSNADARLAIAMFAYSVRKQIGAMTAVLGGADLLVFTGGIGENDAAVREQICAGLQGLAIHVDSAVRVLPSEENVQIALHTRRQLDSTST